MQHQEQWASCVTTAECSTDIQAVPVHCCLFAPGAGRPDARCFCGWCTGCDPAGAPVLELNATAEICSFMGRWQPLQSRCAACPTRTPLFHIDKHISKMSCTTPIISLMSTPHHHEFMNAPFSLHSLVITAQWTS
jgi:hypothetical protein